MVALGSFFKDGDRPVDLVGWLIKDGYIFDYLMSVAALLINTLVPTGKLKTVQRYMVPNDTDTAYPYKDSTISNAVLYILSILFPFVVFLVGLGFNRRLIVFHHALLSLLEGWALTTGFKQWMNLVGRYRPDFQDRLARGDSSEIDDGHNSYPSGHAAYMFVAMTIIAWYLISLTGVLARPARFNFPLALVCISPLVLSTFVAVTRPADHKHHFSDINAGSFIGLACGTFAFLLNFHSPLDEHRCGEPKLRGADPAGDPAAGKQEPMAERPLQRDEA
mmetsp:Transcript_19030/g.52411  ORF Transcript_19030/g.52411 Transcript_19030/m.52411 type:complete len:277 (+) Transcript_19030:223-1053(+)